jgi:hypothetical protein
MKLQIDITFIHTTETMNYNWIKNLSLWENQILSELSEANVILSFQTAVITLTNIVQSLLPTTLTYCFSFPWILHSNTFVNLGQDQFWIEIPRIFIEQTRQKEFL